MEHKADLVRDVAAELLDKTTYANQIERRHDGADQKEDAAR